jgi:hypothetical protein
MMNILDKATHLALRGFLQDPLAPNFVTGKRLPENLNKWAIARQIDSMFIAMFVGTSFR